eukprot:m51a1_g3418 hypothetical protein (116) ;mRNA; f:584973-585320
MGNRASKQTANIDNLLNRYQQKEAQGADFNAKVGIKHREEGTFSTCAFQCVQKHPKAFALIVLFALVIVTTIVLTVVFSWLHKRGGGGSKPHNATASDSAAVEAALGDALNLAGF